MNLHPVDLVTEFTTRNRDALSVIHGQFADIVPQIFAEMEGRHPDGRIHGGVFSANVRDAFLVELEARGRTVAGLRAVEQQFRSVRLYDAAGWPCRVHMHPRDLKTGLHLPTIPLEETLFGPAVEIATCELAVLWRPSPKSKSLKSILLAAVSDIDDRNRTHIYASAYLPPIAMGTYWIPDVRDHNNEPNDDFDDFLGEDETLGDEPA